MKRACLLISFIFSFVVIVSCSQVADVTPEPDTSKTYTSPHNFNDTLSRLRRSLNARQLKVFMEIDHSLGAREAGLELERNFLVLFGNPKVGTAFMQQNPHIGLELPMKALIYERDGQIHLRFSDIESLAETYGLKSDFGPVANVSLTLDLIGQEVVAK